MCMENAGVKVTKVRRGYNSQQRAPQQKTHFRQTFLSNHRLHLHLHPYSRYNITKLNGDKLCISLSLSLKKKKRTLNAPSSIPSHLTLSSTN